MKKKTFDERQNICLELLIGVQYMYVGDALEITTVSYWLEHYVDSQSFRSQ